MFSLWLIVGFIKEFIGLMPYMSCKVYVIVVEMSKCFLCEVSCQSAYAGVSLTI